MPTAETRLPEIDFAADPSANLQEVPRELRATEPASLSRFAGRPTGLVKDHETVSRQIASAAILGGVLSGPQTLWVEL